MFKPPTSKYYLYFIEQIIKRRFLEYLPDKAYVMLDYLFYFGKLPNLRNPQNFSEKIQWLKIYGGLEKYSQYVDKYKVRNFVSQKAGKKYLVPLLGVWEKFEEIDFGQLPKQFVLKATHGSSYNFICKDKSSLNLKKLQEITRRWLRENFYQKTREVQYRDCQPRLIAEPYLEDASGGLTDYKIHCFNGQPYFIEVIWDRFTKPKLSYVDVDLSWRKLPISYRRNPYPAKTPPKPRQLEEMILLAKKLSKPFTYVRVDLYLVRGVVYFGELTFTPGNGMDKFEPPETDFQLGKLIDLSKYR